MFDLGFSEIVLILVVSLVVLGPERLPKVARSVGAMLGRVRSFVSTVKSDIASQLNEQELRDLGNTLRESTVALRREMEGSIHDLEQKVSSMRNDLGNTAWQRLPDMHSPEDFSSETRTYRSPQRSPQQKSRQHHKSSSQNKKPPRPRLRARRFRPS